MDMKRLILFVIFSFSLLVLWNSWLRQNEPAQAVAATTAPATPVTPAISTREVTTAPATLSATPVNGKTIKVTTDIFEAEINTAGGNIQQIELLQHKDAEDQSKPLTLLQSNDKHIYVAQSGLLGADLPNHTASYTVSGDKFNLEPNADTVVVRLTAQNTKTSDVTKVYTFHRGSYLIDVTYEIANHGSAPLTSSAYFQLVRDSAPIGPAMKFVPTFTGPALYTDQGKFKKIEFSEIEKNKVVLPHNPDNGWIGMLQHYFVAAWLHTAKGEREFYTRQLDAKTFSAGVIFPLAVVAPGQTGVITSTLYAGPAQSKLDNIAPGLGLSVDYGWVTIFSKPLFWLMSHLNDIVHNWGIAIILLTVLIKLVFFPLSAASYRSMAKLRLVAPKLEKIKQQYGDDREKLNQAMMDLYKNEKINPLGGCLPMLIQIPVFIALYWAILSSVELRHAPFFGWIQDLSATDPYYVLPIIMGISMLVQSKLNPVPADPLQAKLMQIMPIVFSVVFFFFPAGLVLYSIVNNILSILQQWYVSRGDDAGRKATSKAR